MGVTKQQIKPGNGTDKPKAGDTITMEYTGNLYDANAPNQKGNQFDSSVGRGDFETRIGTGQVIKGTLLRFLPFWLLLTCSRLGRWCLKGRRRHVSRREGYPHHHWVSYTRRP